MQVHIRGKPDYEGLESWQKELLLDPLVEVIQEFYKHPKNRQAYEQWLADGKPMPYSENSKQEVRYEQTKMSI